PADGMVRVTDAHPAGVYLVTITGFDNGDPTAMTTFTLRVTTPPNTCNPVDFTAPADFATGANPRSVAIGDFNRDGNQDLAIANFNVAIVSVLLGDGSGSFGQITDFPASGIPESIAVGDFNNDGRQDLVTANQSTGDVSVFLGNGNGGLSSPVNFAVGAGANPLSVAVGLFNADNLQDLV